MNMAGHTNSQHLILKEIQNFDCFQAAELIHPRNYIGVRMKPLFGIMMVIAFIFKIPKESKQESIATEIMLGMQINSV